MNSYWFFLDNKRLCVQYANSLYEAYLMVYKNKLYKTNCFWISNF